MKALHKELEITIARESNTQVCTNEHPIERSKSEEGNEINETHEKTGNKDKARERNVRKSKYICHFHKNNKCTKGDTCRFRHDTVKKGSSDISPDIECSESREGNEISEEHKKSDKDKTREQKKDERSKQAENIAENVDKETVNIDKETDESQAEENTKNSGETKSPVRQRNVRKSKYICHFYKNNKCTKGDACRFRHETVEKGSDDKGPNITNAEIENGSAVAGKTKQKKVCHYYLNGYCWRGSTCSFLHEKDTRREGETENTDGENAAIGIKKNNISQERNSDENVENKEEREKKVQERKSVYTNKGKKDIKCPHQQRGGCKYSKEKCWYKHEEGEVDQNKNKDTKNLSPGEAHLPLNQQLVSALVQILRQNQNQEN